MRIDAYRAATRISNRQEPGRGKDSARFEVGSSSSTRHAAQTAPVSGTTGIDALLALQGAGDALEQRRRAVRRGHELLDDLEKMRMAVLAGGLSVDQLQRIAARLTTAGEEAPEDLSELIGEIELRVRVELAKHGHYPE